MKEERGRERKRERKRTGEENEKSVMNILKKKMVVESIP